MLSLLCGSPDVVDSPFYSTQSRRPSRGLSISRLGRSGSSKTKKRVLKGSIGAPTAFRHEGHVGADNMMSPAGAWDLDQWRTELEKHMQVQPSARSPVSSSTSPMISPTNSVIAPRRKPVPSLLPAPREERQGSSPSSSAASSPTNPQPIGREQSPGVALV